MTRYTQVAAAIVLGLATTACSQPVPLQSIPPVPFDQMGSQAAEHLRGESDRLLAIAEDGTRSAAARAAAFAEVGRLLQAYGMHAGAVVAYDNALNLGAPVVPTAYLAAVALSDLGRSQDAVAHLDRLLAAAPQHAAGRLRLAQIELEAGRVAAARDLYDQLVAENDSDAAAQAGLGKAALAAGDYQEAIEALGAALSLQPRADSLHRLLAQAHARMGNGERAAQHSRAAGDVQVAMADPDMVHVQSLAVGAGSALRRGDAAMLAGDFVRAAEAYREAVEHSPDDPTIHHSLAAALFRTGNLKAARDAYRRSAELDPANASVRFSLGVTQLRLGQSDAAVDEFRRAIELDDRPEYRTGLAEALWLIGDPEAAEQELLGVLREDSSATPAQAMLIRILIAAPQDSDQVRRAVALATELVEDRPTVEHVELLATAYAAAGHFELAASWQQRLLDQVGTDANPEWRRSAERKLAFFRNRKRPATSE